MRFREQNKKIPNIIITYFLEVENGTLPRTAQVRAWCMLGRWDLRAHLLLGDQWGLIRSRTQQQDLSCLYAPHMGFEGLLTLKTQVAVGPPHGHVWKWFQRIGNICCEFSSASVILKLGWACSNTDCRTPPQSWWSSKTEVGTYSRKHTLRTPISTGIYLHV